MTRSHHAAPQFDVVVIGGGPAGSTAAALIADAGPSALLVERETMPRFHIGESLMPETYWIFQRLGVLDRMKHHGHIEKRSVQFVNHTGKQSRPFFFQEHDPRDCSRTWQVRRSEFDQMLFENAAEKGADCLDQTRVLDVLFDDGRATGVRLQTADGATREVGARVVVDATGQQALVGRRLGLIEENPRLRKAAVWSYYRGVRCDEGDNAGATIIFQTQNQDSWFWLIPLSDEVVSLGVVGDRDYLVRGRGAAERTFDEELRLCPRLAERMAQARRVDEFRVAKEFSYTTRRSAGDGWTLVGDAFGFIDPIYSSGVFFAMKTAEMAADTIVAALADDDLSAARLGGWVDEFEAGARWIRKLVDAFYAKAFSFGDFMRRHPEHAAGLTDILIGRVFHPGAGKIFDDMDPWLNRARDEEVEATSRD